MESVMSHLLVFSFFALPAAAVVWFLVSLTGYLQARPHREDQPDRVRAWRRSLVASAVTVGVLLALCGGIVALLATAVAHM